MLFGRGRDFHSPVVGIERGAGLRLSYAHGFLPLLKAEAHDVPLDAMLTEEGVAWDSQGLGDFGQDLTPA